MDLNEALRRVDKLAIDLEDYDEDETPPSLETITITKELIEKAYSGLRKPLEIRSVGTDYAGCVRVQWTKDNKEVQLSVGSRQFSTYIYHQCDDKYGGDYDPSWEQLAMWLQWMLGYVEFAIGDSIAFAEL